MRIVSSERFERTRQARGQLVRRLMRRPPRVHYFHQVDDPYSHLAVQRLSALAERYALAWTPHLAASADDAFKGDTHRHRDWALADARDIAPFHGVELPGSVGSPPPSASQVDAVNRRLAPLCAAAVDGDRAALEAFTAQAIESGRQLWSGAGIDEASGDVGAGASPVWDAESTLRMLTAGAKRRESLGHHLGALFYFEGDGYWGLDRLYLLEQRLIAEGYARSAEAGLVVPRPTPEPLGVADARAVRVEIFPSLRSPYTAISFQRVMECLDRTGATAILRPVMPMMMRGVAAPRAKQLYILTDSAREARAAGTPMGRIVDPFGEPVRRGLSLWPHARAQGRGREYLQAYLEAAWMDGVDITSDAGLREVVERAGLDWAAASREILNDHWEAELEENLEAMLAENLWGVPSFRVSGGTRAGSFACWGQDRIWRVETEIVRRARAADAGPGAGDE